MHGLNKFGYSYTTCGNLLSVDSAVVAATTATASKPNISRKSSVEHIYDEIKYNGGVVVDGANHQADNPAAKR